MENKKLLTIVISLCLCAAVFAEDPEEFSKWKKVDSSKVAFICRVAITNNLDMDFYAIGFDAVNDRAIGPRYGYVYFEIAPNNVPLLPMRGELGQFSQTILSSSEVRKQFYLQQFVVKLFSQDYLSLLQLPVGKDVSFPPEARYVYLGTFVYTLEGYDLRPTQVKHIDEFDAAQKMLNEKLGTNVQLYRAELVEHKEEPKKK